VPGKGIPGGFTADAADHWRATLYSGTPTGSVQVGASINSGIQLTIQANATISPGELRSATRHCAFHANGRLLHVTDV
jgi:hypothetical protein